MPKGYNFIYDKLVASEEDVVGILAYGIYKRHKIEFIEQFKSKHNKEPEPTDFETFYMSTTTESQLKKYHDQAENMLQETVTLVTGEELKRYEHKMLSEYEERIKSCLPSNWTTFGLGILSTLAFSIIAGIFYFIGTTSEKTTFEKVKQTMETIQQNSQTKAVDTVITEKGTKK